MLFTEIQPDRFLSRKQFIQLQCLSIKHRTLTTTVMLIITMWWVLGGSQFSTTEDTDTIIFQFLEFQYSYSTRRVVAPRETCMIFISDRVADLIFAFLAHHLSNRVVCDHQSSPQLIQRTWHCPGPGLEDVQFLYPGTISSRSRVHENYLILSSLDKISSADWTCCITWGMKTFSIYLEFNKNGTTFLFRTFDIYYKLYVFLWRVSTIWLNQTDILNVHCHVYFLLPQIQIPGKNYWQKMSSHAQVRLKGAEIEENIFRDCGFTFQRLWFYFYDHVM